MARSSCPALSGLGGVEMEVPLSPGPPGLRSLGLADPGLCCLVPLGLLKSPASRPMPYRK